MPNVRYRNEVTRWVLFLTVLIPSSGLRADEAVPSGPGPPAPEIAPVSPPSPPALGPRAAHPVADRTTHLFFAPTARALPQGKGSLALTELIFPSAEVGLTDRVSVGGLGVLPLEDFSYGALGLVTKIQVLRRGHVQAALGVFQAFGAGGSGGLGYGVLTLGSADTAVTVGYAYGYSQLATAEGAPSVVFLGAEKAIGRSWRLIVEGHIGGTALGLPDQTLVGGARFSRGRWSVDLGAVIPIYETTSGEPFPFFTLARAF